MAEYHGEIQNGELVLSPRQNESRQQYLTGMKDGTRVKEVIVRETKDGTYKQIQTIFGLVIAYVIEGMNDLGWDSSYLLNTSKPTGVPITKGLLIEFFYVVCPIEDEDGNRITLSKANIMQRMKFIDDCRNFAASQWGMDIPEPQKNWKGE